MSLMDWNDVQHFLALARSGSVRAAGGALGVSHSTVARRVEALEAQLAARLFDRSRDGYTLTEAGRDMLPIAQRIEGEMSALERGLVGRDERLAGSVTVTCCDSYVSHFLLSELGSFCAAHPQIELAFIVDSRSFNLTKREADIAVRILGVGVEPPDYLIGLKLVPIFVASYIAEAHAHRLDPDTEGTNPRWVSFDDRKMQDAMVAASSYPQVPTWGSFSSLELMVQAVQQGLGIAMLPTYVGDGQIGLRRLRQPDLRHLAELWLLSHPDLRDNARFRATRAVVVQALQKRVRLFQGRCAPSR